MSSKSLDLKSLHQNGPGHGHNYLTNEVKKKNKGDKRAN